MFLPLLLLARSLWWARRASSRLTNIKIKLKTMFRHLLKISSKTLLSKWGISRRIWNFLFSCTVPYDTWLLLKIYHTLIYWEVLWIRKYFLLIRISGSVKPKYGSGSRKPINYRSGRIRILPVPLHFWAIYNSILWISIRLGQLITDPVYQDSGPLLLRLLYGSIRSNLNINFGRAFYGERLFTHHTLKLT